MREKREGGREGERVKKEGLHVCDIVHMTFFVIIHRITVYGH